MRSIVPISAMVLAGGAAVAAGAPAPGPPTPADAWTAALTRPTVARAAPRADAARVAGVPRWTAFWRRPQRLLVLSRVVRDADGRGWVKVRLPGRPNGSSGFVPTSVVRLKRTTVRVRVRVGARRVEIWRSGRRIAAYRAAVGTSSTPTPRGLFAVQDPVPSSPSQRSYLGPYIITLTAYSPVLSSFMGGNGLVAIHGTSAGHLLGRAVSHGCVRVGNRALARLYRMVTPGTPVEIRP
jgi:lipoprotein-anchoring transpeptidase ErfK/SrfK